MWPTAERELERAAHEGAPVSRDVALEILRCPSGAIPDLLASASRMRERYFTSGLRFCSILNAKSGACPEDCAFCAQSAHHRTEVEVYRLKSRDEMVQAYEKAARLPISHFGIVTSGPALDAAGVARVCEAIRGAGSPRVAWCASLGALRAEQMEQLKSAGLTRFHHNLETAESFFPSICTTHAYADRLATIRRARAAGLEVCSGGVLGMGESLEQRVELAAALQREGVDSIPLNFLIPLAGTRLEGVQPMRPLDIIRCVVMFRMTNPRAEIKVCAGRSHMRDLQSLIFFAGATGMMIGDLLTVAGREVEQDLQMLEDLEVDHGPRGVDRRGTG